MSVTQNQGQEPSASMIMALHFGGKSDRQLNQWVTERHPSKNGDL
jgi:hypothetical protein